MSRISEAERIIIAKHPLDNSLAALRKQLREAEQNREKGSFSDDEDSDQAPQKLISRLISTLQGHEVAFDLHSRTGNGNVAYELSTLFGHVQRGKLDYEYFRTLSRLIVNNAPDVEIWSAVFDLIISVSQSTPPTSIPPLFDGTPVTNSSASQQGSEQTRRQVEGRIFEEIKKCTYRNVGDFYSKYFETKKWSERTKKVYQAMQNRYVDRKWSDYPDPPVQNAVLEWLFGLQEELLSKERGAYYTSTSRDLTGTETQRQVDLFVKPRNEKLSKTPHNWKDVEVIGELKEANNDKKSTLLQIGRHGFSIGPALTAPPLLDIHQEPERFISIITAYVMMSDEELGLDTFTERVGDDRFITIKDDKTGEQTKLQLEVQPIAFQRAIVCRGTSCFRAVTPGSRDPQYVVKFSWTSAKRPPEAELLGLARENGVKGVAKLFGHHNITSIAALREGLVFTEPHVFRQTTLSPSASFVQSQPSSLLAQSLGQPPGLKPIKKQSKKRGSTEIDGRPSKRSRSNSQSPDKSKQNNDETSTAPGSQTTSLYAHDRDTFDDRVFRCLVISPAGRAILDYRSIQELLQAFRDSIAAHRSLYIHGKILHRDISENNIIITDPDKTDGYTGMLIDLDLAKKRGSERSGARHQTGTMQFMAIEVLRRVSHTYRHDLESFFYVLLWICARRTWETYNSRFERPVANSRLMKWYTGSFNDIADAKEHHMGVSGFKAILKEFPHDLGCLKPLCEKVRGVLFPVLEDGVLYIGTPAISEKLYDPIIKAFDKAIAAEIGKKA